MEIRITIDVEVRGWFGSSTGHIQQTVQLTHLKTLSGEMRPIGEWIPAGHEMKVDNGCIELNLFFIDVYREHGVVKATEMNRDYHTWDQYKGKTIVIKKFDLVVIPAREDLAKLADRIK